MKLFKNVDVLQLESILEKGIISIKDGAPNDWDEDKRVNNATDRVYLFKPTTPQNSFTQYGLVLVEVDVDDAEEKELDGTDGNRGRYVEYTTGRVDVKNITKIYAPAFLKDRIKDMISKEAFDAITFVDAEIVGSTNVGMPVVHDPRGIFADEKPRAIHRFFTEADYAAFATTAPLSTDEFNFFRGLSEHNTMIDVLLVKYLI